MANKKKKNDAEKVMKRDNSSKINQVDFGGFDSDIWGKIFIVLAVIVVFGLFYLLTIYITNKNSTDDNNSSSSSTNEETVISYDEILLGRSFSMEDEQYIVLYYDKSDEDVSSVYDSLVSSYQGKEDALRIYTVNMGSAFNKSHTTTGEGNHNPTNASELSINGPTLIMFSNQVVVDYIEGEESITSYLN